MLPPAITYAVAASADGKLLVSNCGSSIHVWEVGSWRLLATLDGHADVVYCLTMSRDGKTLISAGWDTAVRIWDVPSQQPRHILNLPDDERSTNGPVRALAVAPNGKQLAISTMGGATTAELTDAGLFYAYAGEEPWPGRIRFVPFDELPLGR